MHGGKPEKHIARQLMLAGLALPIIGAGKAPPLAGGGGSSGASAQAVARIENPVILRTGIILRNGKIQVPRARERPCVSGDLPDEAECRLIVSDIE